MDRKEILRNPNGYPLEELASAITAGTVTYKELCDYGLLRNKREPLQNMLVEPDWQKCSEQNTIEAYEQFIDRYPQSIYTDQAHERLNQLKELAREEDTYWQNIVQENSIEAYGLYLRKYPNGKYAATASLKIELLQEQVREQKERLLNEMRNRPDRFDEFRIKNLLNGQDNEYQGVYLEKEELVRENLITQKAFNSLMNNISFNMPQYTVEQLPPLPNNRTDIYFFGIPKSGKSCVLSGFLYTANKEGFVKYQSHMNDESSKTDPCRQYYDGLINSIDYCVVPGRTDFETCNFMSLNLRLSDDTQAPENPISIIELGGEYFKRATDNITSGLDSDELGTHGVTKYLANENRKMIFFVIDYSRTLLEDLRIEDSDIIQRQCLDRALDVFSRDGTGSNGANNCTFSKTDSIIVIVTKSDLMGVDSREERLDVAKEYLQSIYKNFMVSLRDVCEDFNINAAVGNKPLVTTFSLGRFMLGNTVDFNDRDSLELINLIRGNTRSKKNASSIKELLKNILSIS